MVVCNESLDSRLSVPDNPNTLLVEIDPNGSVEQKFLVSEAGCRILFHMLPNPAQLSVCRYNIDEISKSNSCSSILFPE